MSPTYNTLTDQELISELRLNNDFAFREIYNRFWNKLYVIAYKRLGASCEAEELVQDIFFNLWRKRNTLILTKSFDHYFAVAAKFEIINRLAKRSRDERLKANAADFSLNSDSGVVDKINLDDLQNQLNTTIKSLPEKCQIVFKLKYEQDYSQKQISEELNIAEKTVETHLSKARKILKSSLRNF